MKLRKYSNVIVIIVMLIIIIFNIYVIKSNLRWIYELTPVVINVSLILFVIRCALKSEKIFKFIYTIGIVILLFITLSNGVGKFDLTKTKRKFYSSPNQINTIIVEKKQLLGQTSIDIYETKYIFFKFEIATQVLGNHVKVKWVNDYMVDIIIDKYVNRLNLSQ